eukprot:scaffold14749_cov126-Isochrysis_galbana.AAC.3
MGGSGDGRMKIAHRDDQRARARGRRQSGGGLHASRLLHLHELARRASSRGAECGAPWPWLSSVSCRRTRARLLRRRAPKAHSRLSMVRVVSASAAVEPRRGIHNTEYRMQYRIQIIRILRNTRGRYLHYLYYNQRWLAEAEAERCREVAAPATRRGVHVFSVIRIATAS